MLFAEPPAAPGKSASVSSADLKRVEMRTEGEPKFTLIAVGCLSRFSLLGETITSVPVCVEPTGVDCKNIQISLKTTLLKTFLLNVSTFMSKTSAFQNISLFQ